MTLDEAKKAALREIQRTYKGQEEIAVDDAHTITRPYGWVFFYNTKRYIERRDVLHALGGNGPIVVEGTTGRITKLGTARPVDDEISDFELMNGYRS